MTLEKTYAQLSCSDLSASPEWFEQLFGRRPDARPMEGLVEHARLAAAGLRPGEVEPADTTSLVRLRDPDDNLVVLAQAGRV